MSPPDRLYTAILKAQPQHCDANHGLGTLAVSVGKIKEAIPFFQQAVKTNPIKANYWESYIDALIELENFAGAKAILDKAISKERIISKENSL
mgnify:CR=1 FL=1